MDELKPCPFCGGEAFSREYDEQRPDEPYGLVVYHAPACFLAPHADHSGFEARWNTRSPVTDEMVEKAEKLLREVCDDLARSTPIQMPDPRISEDVEKLAVASGYGAIMQTASCLWRQYLADKGYPKGGEFIAGPCRTTAEMIIGRITAFLKQGAAS